MYGSTVITPLVKLFEAVLLTGLVVDLLAGPLAG